MTINALLNVQERFEIQTYYSRTNKIDRRIHVPFSGSPRKHPFEKDKIILVVDPFTSNTFYYEFEIKDICFAEELANITNINGKSVSMTRIWIRKKSVAILCTPFVVDTMDKADC
ncbi:MAG: inorganic pyrophosphatase Ppa [Desulfobacterium sp.]|jgi:inorganic pyrophosphatase|nr:inorganic pyrophosphatase Ppa [Desulfobacterium sp.]